MRTQGKGVNGEGGLVVGAVHVCGRLHLSWRSRACVGPKVELGQGAAGEDGKEEKLSAGWTECDSAENLWAKAINNFY